MRRLGMTTSHPPFGEATELPPIGVRSLGGPIEASQPLLGPPTLSLRNFSAISNRARPENAACETWGSDPHAESAPTSTTEVLSAGSPTGAWHRRVNELASLSLRGLSSIMYPLSYPLRRHVLGRALKDALGDRRLAFVLFSHWLQEHPTIPSLSAIFWAHNKLALAPSETPSPYVTGWDGTQAQAPRGAGRTVPAPHKGVEL